MRNLTGILSNNTSRTFIKHSGILLSANIIVTLLGAIRTPLMTWVIPKEEIGMLGVLYSWMPFVQLLSLSGLDASIYHYITKGYPRAFWIGTKSRLRWSVLALVILAIGGFYWMFKGETILGWLFIISALSFPFTNGLSASAGYISALQKFNSLFWYRLWESLTDFFGFIPILFALIWNSYILTFYSSNQIATTVMQVLVALFILSSINKSKDIKELSLSDDQELIRYGRHLTVINAISTIHSRSDAFIVGAFTSLNTMADYSIGLLVAEQINRFWSIFVTLRYPKLVLLEKRTRQIRFVREGMIISLLLFLVGIALVIAAIILIPIILPSVYLTSMRYIVLLVVSNVLLVPGMVVEMYFRTEQHEKFLYTIRVIAAISGLSLPLALVFPWGANGVVFGKIAANLIMSVSGIFLFFRHTHSIELPK